MMDKSCVALEQKLLQHRALKDSFPENYTFDPNDTNTYSYAEAMTKAEKLERTLLIRDYGAITLEGFKLEQFAYQTVVDELELNLH